MKKSIRWKMTFIFIIVVVCCIASIFLFNVLFLENIYINEKKNILKKTYQVLDKGIIDSYKNGYDLSDLFNRPFGIVNAESENSFLNFLNEMQDSYNVNIILMDKDNRTYSLFRNSDRFDRLIMNYIFRDIADDNGIKVLEINDNYTMTINEHLSENQPSKKSVSSGGPSEYYENQGPGAKTTKRRRNFSLHSERNSDIECVGFLSDRSTAFFMTIPVSSIKEPIRLFNNILIVISFFIIIFGSVAIYFISLNLSNPLLKLSEISKKMSRLQFENKYIGNSDDEIGILGTNMNEMSDKLEKSIKELKNANIKLKKDLEQKEQLDLMRQEFVANVSHELKTPIALIEGYAEGLETEGIADNKESRQYYIDVIKDETEKMNHMVRELLDLSALERGMSDIEIARLSLNEMVDGLLKSEDIKIKEKKVDVSVDIEKDTYVWADGYKLDEVLRNYFTNALNHLDEHKTIKIYTEKLNDDKIRMNIYNSGIKLDENECKKIWEKFYKVDKARTRAYGGTGLGLSIVKAIAEKHNTTCGCIPVDSTNKVYSGMIFYFDLSTK